MSLFGWLFGTADGDEDEHEQERGCGCGGCAERWRLAVHEAGHVLAFDEFGEGWEYAQVVPVPDGDGFDAHVLADRDSDDLTGDDLYWRLVIAQAGHVADLLTFGRFVPSAADEELIADMVGRWGVAGAEQDAWDDAEKIITGAGGDLEEIAAALFYDEVIYP